MPSARKLVALLATSLFAQLLFCQQLPSLLGGVWASPSQYCVFDTGYLGDELGSIPQLVLRVFYGWYDDRAAESPSYTVDHPRDANCATAHGEAQAINVRYYPLTSGTPEGEDSGAWNLEIRYPARKEVYNVPVAVIGGNLYLDFLIKDSATNTGGTQDGDSLDGFWQDALSASGIQVSPPVFKKELACLYIQGDKVYRVRYWKTDMEFDAQTKAELTDEGETYLVPKHLNVAGTTYTCTKGRRHEVRNVERLESLPPYTANGTKGGEGSFTGSTILSFAKPYLARVEGKSIDEILAEDALKRPPQPKPLFPPGGVLDFDWSIVADPPADWSRRVLDLGK